MVAHQIRSFGMRMALCCAASIVVARVASANVLSLQCENQPVFAVSDNGPGDDNMLADIVQHAFSCTHPDGRWQAGGVLTGVYLPNESATTTMSDFYVEKLTPELVLGNTISWEHQFTPYTTALGKASAMIDGTFDNPTNIFHDIGGITLVYDPAAANVNQVFPILPNLGQQFDWDTDGFGPIDFDGAGGPIDVVSPNRHTATMIFYLDAVGDRIDMHNSAVIHSQVPEPTSLSLVAMGFLALCQRRRGRQRSAARSLASDADLPDGRVAGTPPAGAGRIGVRAATT